MTDALSPELLVDDPTLPGHDGSEIRSRHTIDHDAEGQLLRVVARVPGRHRGHDLLVHPVRLIRTHPVLDVLRHGMPQDSGVLVALEPGARRLLAHGDPRECAAGQRPRHGAPEELRPERLRLPVEEQEVRIVEQARDPEGERLAFDPTIEDHEACR